VRPQLDEDLVQRVHDLGPTAFSGTCFRHVSGQRNPLSGVGACLNGGRWNPVGLSTIYLAIPVGACMGELTRLAQSQNITPDDLLAAGPGRVLITVAVQGLQVQDLRAPVARAQLGLELNSWPSSLASSTAPSGGR
jgi:RES domain-containing protein